MSEETCAGCGTANEADARFCEGCGSALARRCAACGTQASATARFCRSCGGSLDGLAAEPPAVGPTRKTVTVLFADLAGSTAFEEKVDVETAREVMGQYHTLLRETAERHRAGVVKYIGDGFMAVWGVPEVSATDADRAVDAAVELQERFVGLAASVADVHGEDLALRVAVNTGEVVVGAGDADLVGDALNVAARLESECPHGHVVAGEETWRATRGRYRYEPLSRVQVKGRGAPVAVYQWAGRRSEPADSVPFVGRHHEFRRLQTVLEDAVVRREARLVTVVGDPGVGKTRLATEFSAGQRDAEVLQIRCAAEGTVALAPVVEALRPRDLDVDLPAATPERDRILRDLNGMTDGVASSVEETFWGLRRYFEVLAERGRLILVLDDVQWADALLIDFIEHLSEWVRDAPILMIALARPELRENRPELVTVGGWVGDAIRLDGLEPGATAELATRVLGSGRLPADLLARLPSSTGGNPLFVRELVAMLVHDGVLVAEADGWRLTIDADAIAVPPTIQALLASRLERMNTADRRVLETASVIGTDFSPAGVCALNGASAAEVKASLDRLRRLELAQPSGAYAGDDPVWRFHHILIRDVAYRRLLKSDRAELHERFADWSQTDGRTGVFESDELVARHLESAYGYRRELGARDSHIPELALRSARSYLSAARRALERDALVSAGAQAARGAALATADAALQAELLLVGCEAYLSAGDVAAGGPLVDELDRIADDALAPWATCYRCQHLVYTDPAILPEIDGRLQSAIEEFARRGDHAGLAKAYRVRANARARLGRIGECEADLFEALIAARQGSDHRQITAALGAAPNAALWGPSPAPKAGGRCLDVVRMQRMTTAAPSLEATSLRCLAVLELLRGRPDKARSMLADAREIVSELGLRHGLMETELYAGIIEWMVGDPVAAEPHFRTALEGLDSLGVGADAGQAAALLARSLLAQGRMDEADHYAAESERIAGHNLKTAIGWRAVRAEILSAQGRHREAVAMAREAMDVASETDLVLDYADACMTLSRVLADSGDSRGGAEARSKGESLYAAKDAVFLVGAAARPADRPPAAAPTTEAAGRLKAVNRACDVVLAGWQSLKLEYTEGFVYDDHRKVSGEPLCAPGDFVAAALRKQEQYPHVEAEVLGVRGQTLALIALRWRDDAGNQTMSLDLYEVDESDRLFYHGRFDDDDFAGAYRMLEERYYAGEGEPFAANGLAQLELLESLWLQDVKTARRATQPNAIWIAAPSTLKPGTLSLGEFFARRAERLRQVASFRDWQAVLRWSSPECCVSLVEIRGTGRDGEDFRWNRIYVMQFREGRLTSGHEFDAADEDRAFAYAESLAGRERRLVVRNRASAAADGIIAALMSNDTVGAAALYAEDLNYDDRRRLGGNAVTSKRDYVRGLERLRRQYSHFQNQTLAVRGERTALVWSRVSDPAGNEAAYLHVFELDERGLISYEGRFDEDDFAGAYRVLEERYYAGEGAAFAVGGLAQLQFGAALLASDVEEARPLVQPDFVLNADPSTLKPAARSLEEMFRWGAERFGQVASFHMWIAVLEWMSSEVCVSLLEMRGTGHDGEEYRWPRYAVTHVRDGLLASGREFDVDDENAAFAYAESLLGREHSRLVVRNRASVVTDGAIKALRSKDSVGLAALYSDDLIYHDRRRLSGNTVATRSEYLRNMERIVAQYGHVETRILAVRGERSVLLSGHFRDLAGNETEYLHIFEIDDHGLISYEGRFDEDDFLGAYAELERRYYAGEGASFAESGRAAAGWVEGIGRRDIEMVRRVSTPDFRWVASASSLKAAERTVEDMFDWMQERGQQVSSMRHWLPVYQWLSPACAVGLVEVSAVGPDGEPYLWTYHTVSQFRDGLVASIREFDTEKAAFAYAESIAAARPGRLAVANRGSVLNGRLLAGMQARDPDAAADNWADRFIYDDRRTLSGEPITTRAEMRDALERIIAQYNNFQGRVLAVRGEHINLAWHCWSDADGNESTSLTVAEIGEDDRVIFEARFDEDDFEAAYLELERRYRQGEGAPLAEASAALSQVLRAESRGDLDSVFRRFAVPGLRIESRSRSVFPTRTPSELRESLEELGKMVGPYQVWSPAVYWLSPEWVVARHQREAVGADGQPFAWSRIYALHIRNGLMRSVCEFDADDEDLAIAYAEERMRAAASRLAVSNRATEVRIAGTVALQNGDIDAASGIFSEHVVLEDRRRMSGEPPARGAGVRAALEKLRHDYSHFDGQFIAVRGDNLVLARYGCSDEDGNRTSGLSVTETGADGRVISEVRFDEDDFESAYLELERRHYAGEGAAYAEAGALLTELVIAGNRGDLDKIFGELFAPDIRVESRSRTIIPNRTANELRSSYEEFNAMVSWSRVWNAAVYWMSPTVAVVRQEREAAGRDGERYEWSRIYVGHCEGGRVTAGCEFDVEFEDEAFAYAEELVHRSRTRLAVSNRASEVRLRVWAAVQRGDLDAAAGLYSDDLVYDDRRRLSGEPVAGRGGMREALGRLRNDYSRFGGEILAVRGDRLGLGSYDCSDDDGNQTTGLLLVEVNEDDRVCYEGRFDEDDFETAYNELERRYCAGEGASSADFGMTMANYFAARNRGDLDTLFNSLSSPDLRLESRSHSVFVVRSAVEHRASIEELTRLVGSVRDWASAVHNVSPTWGVCRYQREALGQDGEDYTWERLVVAEVRDGRLHYVCDFDLDDEDAAFAYAEERARASASRLAVTNRAAEVLVDMVRALSRRDIDVVVDAYREDCSHDDRRRLAGGLLPGRAELRAAVDRILRQFTDFQWRTLAVRGQGLAMGWTRWSDDSGNMSNYLIVVEVDDNGRIIYEGWFDGEDFETAYNELERRYCASEGTGFAEHGMTMARYFAAKNRAEFDTLFNSLSTADFSIESRSHTLSWSARSTAEFRDSLERLMSLVESFREWLTAVLWVAPNRFVGRFQREALGRDGEDYSWERFVVGEFREGRLAFVCDFDVEDEEAAFAYAEERARASETRLAVTNRASEVVTGLVDSLHAGDVDAMIVNYRKGHQYDDRRRLTGDPVVGTETLRSALERILMQYKHFEWRPLAVRGAGLVLGWSRWSDDAGNVTSYLHVVETDGDGRIVYDGRFDTDDFESAYRELDERFSAGEGIDFAVNLPMQAALFEGLNRLDPEVARKACLPSFRIISPPTTLASVERSFTEFYAWIAERAKQVPGIRHWMSVNHWLSADCLLSRIEIRLIGPEGDEYTWPRIAVSELLGGRIASIRQFEIDDEDSAFAYAEKLCATQRSMLPLRNIASETAEAGERAMKAGDIEALVDLYADDYVFDDRRKLSGDSLHGRAAIRAAGERLLTQFSRFESRGLAVRGMRFALGWSRWSDAAGNEADYLHVFETGDDGRIIYDGRFDEDDFDSAYAELERRYYAGEGGGFEESGKATAAYLAAVNSGDFATAIEQLTCENLRVENRSRSAFPDRSVADLRTSLEQLQSMVSSVRSWFFAVRWVSPSTVVSRMEREAVGKDGQNYAWSRILVTCWKEGRLAAIYDFDADDEDAAFACAEGLPTEER